MADNGGYEPPQPVSALIPKIETSWQRWLDAIERVPAHRRAESGVCGDWSVKDLLGHVAFWDTQVLDDIDAYESGQPPLLNPWEDWNHREVTRRAALPVETIAAEMHDAHARMLERLAAVREIDPTIVAVDTWEHYDAHAAEIDRWLGSVPTEP